ncbi:10948_t:CDS:1, partial [Funneliformis geosporum]
DNMKEIQIKIDIAQRKYKERHDRKLSVDYNFKIGQLVLKYENKIEGKKKLKEWWNGPYYIHDDLENGVYKLRTMD